MTSCKLGLIGAGRMGFAIASALIRGRVFKPKELIMADPSAACRRRAAKLGCRHTSDACTAASLSETIILAVKPQKISDVAAGQRLAVRNKRVISILAGTTTKRLAELLPGARIVRVMPNTPLLAGRGAIVIARDGVSRKDLQFATRLFESMGRVWTAPEKWMNAVTAISGSGPALFCAFLEALMSAGRAVRLPVKFAEELSIATMAGTSRLLRGSSPAGPCTPQKLREMVTSPGGTTEAALRVFSRRDLKGVVHSAVRAAVRRGISLSR